MKVIVAIFVCFAFAGCWNSVASQPPTRPGGVIRVPDAECIFALPEGWFRMPKESWYISRGFSAAFQKGEDETIPSSYFLIQVKQQKKPLKDLKYLADKAAPLESIQDLTLYISNGKHKEKTELYNSSHDVYVFVKEYEDAGKQSTTVMVKRFCENHYFIFHFYLRGNMEEDVDVIADVLKSMRLDEERIRTVE